LSSLLKIPVSFLFITFSLTSHGSDPYRLSAGAREAGMGYVCVMNNSFWASFHNQATLALNNSFSAGVNYENRFGLIELGTRTAGILIPAGKASAGAIYSCFGYPDFKREMAGLACGLKISEKLAAGVQIDYFSERTSGEYDNYQVVTCEAGLLILPSDNLRIGMHLFNPVPNSIRKTNMPAILRIGAGADLSTTFSAGVEIEMSSGRKGVIRTGFEFEAAKVLLLRGGFSTDNNSFSFGVGYVLRSVNVDIGFLTHEKLGVTSSASLIFKIH